MISQETGFKLGEIVPQLKEILQQLEEKNSLKNILQNYNNYFALVYDTDITKPLYYTNIEKLKLNYIKPASTLQNKKTAFLVATKNIVPFININRINLDKAFKNQLKVTVTITNNGLVHANEFVNINILKQLLDIVGIKYSRLTPNPLKENIKDEILIINSYYLT